MNCCILNIRRGEDSMLNSTLNMVKYEFSRAELFFHLAAYSLISFFVPFLIGHPQWVVGIIVNSVLILTALNLKKYSLLPVIILPSIGVLSRGLIFGPYTPFLIYFIPFIWIGNAIILFLFKWLNVNKRINYFITLLISAAAKTGFLFATAFILYKLALVPAVFLTAMGALQFLTALGGGVVAWGAVKFRLMHDKVGQ